MNSSRLKKNLKKDNEEGNGKDNPSRCLCKGNVKELSMTQQEQKKWLDSFVYDRSLTPWE